MALKLARPFYSVQLLGLHLPIRNGVYCSHCFVRNTGSVDATWKVPSSSSIKLGENSLLYPEVPHMHISGSRNIHASAALWKKINVEAECEMLRILDPAGQYMCTAEMLVLNKFCSHYHRYSHKVVDLEVTDVGSIAGINDNNKLRVFQLVDKKKDSAISDKKRKIFKFSKDKNTDEKLRRIYNSLLLHGEVMINFEMKGLQTTNSVLHTLEAVPGLKIVNQTPLSTIATLTEVDTKLLLTLFSDVQEQEAKYIAGLKELLNMTEKM